MSNQNTNAALTNSSNSNSSFDASMILKTSLNDKYAELIEPNFYFYYGVEIHGVKIIHSSQKPKGTICEVNDESPLFFSVYAHLIPSGDEGGIECIGDFGTHELAKEYAAEIAKKYHWPVLDCVESAKIILN